MNNIHISDLTDTKLQELDLLADSENGLKDLSHMELDNVQGGIAPLLAAGYFALGFNVGFAGGLGVGLAVKHLAK